MKIVIKRTLGRAGVPTVCGGPWPHAGRNGHTIPAGAPAYEYVARIPGVGTAYGATCAAHRPPMPAPAVPAHRNGAGRPHHAGC